jgi:hypothetical protein
LVIYSLSSKNSKNEKSLAKDTVTNTLKTITEKTTTSPVVYKKVQKPEFLMNLQGETSWYASPVVTDLNNDGKNELIAAYYSVYVFDHNGKLLDKINGNGGRIYAPHIVADLDGDNIKEVVFGSKHQVFAYEWRAGKLRLKTNWPVDTTSAGKSPEVRGMAAGDIDGDKSIEIVVTTTQTQKSGSQVFVYSANGKLYQPKGTLFPAWPRYNTLKGNGGDADRNIQGHEGYGCYGLNVGIGNIDDDNNLEIIVTYDNHHIQAFNHDGVAINASSYFTNRSSKYFGKPLTWGQFIRWADPEVEKNHYNLHTKEWPHPKNNEWLQWTASPPNIADLDNDGKNEIVGIPNIEKNEPYETQAYGIMVLEGAYGDKNRSAMRKKGWEILPRGDKPILVNGWYPPIGIPAPATVDIQGDKSPEIVVSLNDGYLYAYSANGKRLWRCNYAHGKKVMYSSESTIADLNQDNKPEIILTTYGSPNTKDSGNLMIISSDGNLLYDIPLRNKGQNGNGNGAPAAPTVADLTGDRQLEIFIQTFEHGMDIYTVPGSANNNLTWPTSRGNYLRTGQVK